MYLRAMPKPGRWIVVGAALLALAGCEGEDDGSPEPSEPYSQRLRPIEDARERGDFHSVPRERRAQVRRIIAADPRLAELLGGIGYRVHRMGPWTNADSPALVGVMVDLRLDRPLTRDDVRLPTIDYDDSGTSYEDGEARFRISGADELTVLVEFRRARVVDIDPMSGTVGSP